jgi:hypothetical protein
MNGKDVVRSLVPTYPPYGSSIERGGLLDGKLLSNGKCTTKWFPALSSELTFHPGFLHSAATSPFNDV